MSVAGFVLNLTIVIQILLYSKKTERQAQLRAKKKE